MVFDTDYLHIKKKDSQLFFFLKKIRFEKIWRAKKAYGWCYTKESFV